MRFFLLFEQDEMILSINFRALINKKKEETKFNCIFCVSLFLGLWMRGGILWIYLEGRQVKIDCEQGSLEESCWEKEAAVEMSI